MKKRDAATSRGGTEGSLLEKISRAVGTPPADVTVGIGDDAAVLARPAAPIVVTVDMLVEGVHFDRSYSPPDLVGWKALAVSLSDIAAMGAEPRHALVSLALPAPVDEAWVEKLYGGMRKLADLHRVAIVGGNVTRAPVVIVDVTVLGEASSGKPFLRSGARPGDLVVYTGSLGLARAGLESLVGKGGQALAERRQLAPEPRLAESRALRAAGGVTSMIDISDGLSSELWHLAEASGVTILVDKEVPVPAGVEEQWVWEGGEDYELLFTWSPDRKLPQEVPLTVIGRVAAGEAAVRRHGNDVPRRGWDPFIG